MAESNRLQWSLQEKKLELKYAWNISRNTSSFKINFFVNLTDGEFTGTGEVAPNIRYGETPELIREQFNTFSLLFSREVPALEVLENRMREMNLCNSLRFGIESAYVHFLCLRNGMAIYEFLDLDPAPARIPTFYSLPIMPVGELAGFVKAHNLQRFNNLKVKVNQENALELVLEAARLSRGPIAIDANEAWTDPDALLTFCEKIGNLDIAFLEQPMPSAMVDEYRYLKPLSPFIIMADESVTDEPDLAALSAGFHGVNMKLMKAGGYLNGIRILKETRQRGLITMIGCMVETSLGISSALHLGALVDYADLDGFLILENDPFGMVEEEDGKLALNSAKITYI